MRTIKTGTLINIIGNIATGKSTLAKALSEQLDIPYISIDKYRERFYNGTAKAEKTAQETLIHDLVSPQLIILEHSGVGRYRYVYQRTFSKTVTIICQQPLAIIKANINNRTEEHTAYIPLAWQDSTKTNIQNAWDAAIDIDKKLKDEPYNIVYNYKVNKIEDIIIYFI